MLGGSFSYNQQLYEPHKAQWRSREVLPKKENELTALDPATSSVNGGVEMNEQKKKHSMNRGCCHRCVEPSMSGACLLT